MKSNIVKEVKAVWTNKCVNYLTVSIAHFVITSMSNFVLNTSDTILLFTILYRSVSLYERFTSCKHIILKGNDWRRDIHLIVDLNVSL